MNPFGALMKAGQQAQPNQAISVHHTGDGTIEQPEPGSHRAVGMELLRKHEEKIRQFGPDGPSYDPHMYNHHMTQRGLILHKLKGDDEEHFKRENTSGTTPDDMETQDWINKAEPYTKGMTPQGRQAR